MDEDHRFLSLFQEQLIIWMMVDEDRKGLPNGGMIQCMLRSNGDGCSNWSTCLLSEQHDHCGSHANDHGDQWSDGSFALCDPSVSLSRMFAISEGIR